MNNKGFTLIELIGIIIILVAIFLVSFPSFLNMSKTEEENKYKNMVNDLCLAGESYIYSNMDQYMELKEIGSIIEISIDELIIYGSVDSDVTNPKNDTTISKDLLKYTVLDDYSLECIYIERE